MCIRISWILKEWEHPIRKNFFFENFFLFVKRERERERVKGDERDEENIRC